MMGAGRPHARALAAPSRGASLERVRDVHALGPSEIAMLKLIVVGLLLTGSSSLFGRAGIDACTATECGQAKVALRGVDDPPPEPLECPFCGGNPELHRARIQALEIRCADIALFATRAF
jgi:hypothetical protein